MAAERLLAFVLNTRDYRETSLLATFFTKEHGKVKAVVKGIREGRTRFGSSLEPFSLNEIVFYRRKRGDLHLVSEADLIERFDALRRDIGLLGVASYFAELLDKLTEEHGSSEEIFDLFYESLVFLKQSQSIGRSARFFEAKLMQKLGWMSDLSGCIRCAAVLEDKSFFSISSGGVVCSRCRSGEGPLVPISKGVLCFLSHAVDKPFADLHKYKVTQEVGEKVEQVMRQFVGSHLGARPRSLIFLEKIQATNREMLCTSRI